MVANLTVVLLCWFRTGRASLQTSNENRGERKPKPPATVCGKPSRWCGQSVQILLNYVGCEARKLPAGGEVFFLDFSFYRANRKGSDAGFPRLVTGSRLVGSVLRAWHRLKPAAP